MAQPKENINGKSGKNHCPANGHLRLNEVLDIKGYCGK
jgi:hypothetical protein